MRTNNEDRGEEKELLIAQLKKMPIVQIACDRAKIGRSTYYRWRKEDQKFCTEADEAISDGEQLINDMSETQIVTLIKEKSFPAINLWLRQHHPKYGNKLEVTARIKNDNPLTPEQEALICEALGVDTEHEQT